MKILPTLLVATIPECNGFFGVCTFYNAFKFLLMIVVNAA